VPAPPGASRSWWRRLLPGVGVSAEDVGALEKRLAERSDAADWSGALDAWENLRRAMPGPSSEAYTHGARALRASGRFHEAISLATEGIALHPDARDVPTELAKSRAATTDWRAALRPLDTGDPIPGGRVDSLGSLAGDKGPIRGTLDLEGATSVPVHLVVSGLLAATTHAVAPPEAPDGPGRFALRADQLLEYLGDGDVLTVEARDRKLHLDGYGSGALVVTGYPSRADALERRLDNGAVFTKFGKLRPGNSPKRKRSTLDRFEAIRALVEAEHDLHCTPMYGNLLGAIRDGDFIPHDVGGFDAGYVSAHRAPAQIRAEFVAVCRTLLRAGYHLELEPWAAAIRRSPGERLFVDLNYGWFGRGGGFRTSYGWRYHPVEEEQALALTRTCRLFDRDVVVPAGAEAVLEQWYGPRWRVPDQGFEPSVELQRDLAPLLRPQEQWELQGEAPERVVVAAELGPDGALVRHLGG
jgi:hypothetical protein